MQGMLIITPAREVLRRMHHVEVNLALIVNKTVWTSSFSAQTFLSSEIAGHFIALDRNHQAQVIQRVDNAIHWMNCYLVDRAVCFANTYPPDSDLSVG